MVSTGSPGHKSMCHEQVWCPAGLIGSTTMAAVVTADETNPCGARTSVPADNCQRQRLPLSFCEREARGRGSHLLQELRVAVLPFFEVLDREGEVVAWRQSLHLELAALV